MFYRFRTIINTLIRIGPAILTFGQLIIVSYSRKSTRCQSFEKNSQSNLKLTKTLFIFNNERLKLFKRLYYSKLFLLAPSG